MFSNELRQFANVIPLNSILPKCICKTSAENDQFGGHFVFCNFEEYRDMGEGDRPKNLIQHTHIMLKKWSVSFSPKMPLEV
jgi:hypothetical protein